MDSDSSDSDDGQNTHLLFNARQTEAVVKCVEWVLNVISKKAAISKKHVKKPIRKEKKAKLKKSEVVDVQTHIQALCDTFKSIAFSLRCPQADVPGPSKHSEAVAGSSKHSEAVPGPSRHKEAITESSRHSEAIPRSSKHSKSVSESSRYSEAIPESSKHREAVPGSSKHSEAVPGTSRHREAITESSRLSEAIPGTSKQSDAVPGPSRHSEATPGSSRHSEVIPRSSKHSKSVPESSRYSEATPGSSRHSEVIPRSSKHSKSVPESSRYSEAIPGSSKHSEADPGSSRHSKAIPGTSRHSEVIPRSSKHTKAVPESSRHSEEILRSSKHSKAVPECSKGSEVFPTSRHSEAITGNFRPNIETAPVSLSHGTERVAPETSFKKKSGDITKNTKTTESFGVGPKTATNSAIEDQGTSENCTNATSGIPRTHMEVATGSSRPHSENIISTSRSDVAEPRTDTKTGPEISGSSTKIMPVTSKYLSTKAQETSSTNPENISETSKSFKDAVKETSKTLPEADNRTAENLIVVSSGLVLESSRQNMEIEMSGTPASQSDVPISGTSRHTEIVAPDIPDSSTKTMPGTAKNPTETYPPIPLKYPENVVTEISAIFVKPKEEISKCGTETTNPRISRDHTELMVSGTTGSCTADPETAESHTKDHHGHAQSRTKAVSENSEKHVIVDPATKTLMSETKPGTTRNDSNAELRGISSSNAVIESSESNNIAVEYNSLNRHDKVPSAEGNSQICTKMKVATTESEEINNNISATKRNTEKRKRANSIVDGPKRARIDDKCTLCGESVSNVEFAKHYREQHGLHHEIQHNNRNFENKIQDLDKRLHNTNRNKTNNEQDYKVTVDSKKRTAARSSSAPNEDTKQSVANSTLVIITDSAVAKEPEGKKKRTSTRSDSAPNESIEPTSSIIVKEETNQNKVLDAFVIDLTEDDDLGEPSTDITVTKCSPKPGDDDQTLNDSKFIDPSDDTSLYETPDENEAKLAEALLLETVKDEKAANNQYDIEVVSDFFPNTEKPSNIESLTIGKQNTEQIAKSIDQRDSLKMEIDSDGVVSETARRGTPRGFSPISNTKIKDETSLNLSDQGTASHSQASKSKFSNNIATVMSTESPLIQPKAASETAENRRQVNLGTLATRNETIQTIVLSGINSKDVPAISHKHAAQTKQKTSHRDEKQNNKHTRKTPYEKPNKTSLYTDKITATNATNAPRVTMLNATTTITTTDTSKVLNEEAKQPNSSNQHTSNTNNNANTLKTSPGFSITINSPKDSVPNFKAAADLKQQSLPHKMPNLLNCKPYSTSKVPVTPRTSKWASDSAPVLLPRRHSNTKPREHLQTQNNPANVQDAQIHQPVIMSTHGGPGSPISQARDSRNTENILPCHTNLTPPTSRSAPKQHPIQINTSDFRNIPATSVPGHPCYFPHSYRKKSNTAVQIPLLVNASTREININITSHSNLASRNRNAQVSTAVNAHISHSQTHIWHTPVEPPNDITERIVQSLAVRNLNSVASLSNRTPIINQRPGDNQRINLTQSSSSLRPIQPSVFPRQQSSLLERRPRPIQNGRTWHTPVREHRTDN